MRIYCPALSHAVWCMFLVKDKQNVHLLAPRSPGMFLHVDNGSSFYLCRKPFFLALSVLFFGVFWRRRWREESFRFWREKVLVSPSTFSQLHPSGSNHIVKNIIWKSTSPVLTWGPTSLGFLISPLSDITWFSRQLPQIRSVEDWRRKKDKIFCQEGKSFLVSRIKFF